MEWPAYVQSPVDWDPAWNEWVGLPETPRSARPASASIKPKTETNDDMLPDAREYQQLVLAKVGEMERYRSPANKPNKHTGGRPVECLNRSPDENANAQKPAVKPRTRTAMQQVRHAAALHSQLTAQPSSRRQQAGSGKSGKHNAQRVKGRVYGVSAVRT